jgi:hypothetical protein
MKTRTGFVSNSSSSSFIIGLSNKPSCVEDVHKELFDTDEVRELEALYDEDEKYTTLDVAQQVYEDVSKQKPTNLDKGKKEILENINSGWFEGMPDYNYYDTESTKFRRKYREETGEEIHYDKTPKDIWEKYQNIQKKESEERRKELDKAANRLFEKYRDKFADKKIYFLSYSDNDGSFQAFMEHGGIFDKIPNITISNH